LSGTSAVFVGRAPDRKESVITPRELANSLGISPKTLRQWLRHNWPPAVAGARWELTDEQIDLARKRWPTGGRMPAEPRKKAPSLGVGEAILTEDQVVDAVTDYLTKAGWTIVGVAHVHEHGDDITAERDGARMVVEAKGAGSSKVGTKRFGLVFNRGQVRTHIAVAVLRMLGVTSAGTAYAAVALPDNQHHRAIFDKAATSIHAAGVGVFWVDAAGRVSEVSLPWEKSQEA
jgi:hypothetical protein